MSQRSDIEQLGMIVGDALPDDHPARKELGQLVMFAKRAAWPAELHAQYMDVLAERDEAYAEIEYLRAKLVSDSVHDTAVTHSDTVEATRRASGPECKRLRGENDVGPDCGCLNPQDGCILGIGWL